jgi:MFS family permease
MVRTPKTLSSRLARSVTWPVIALMVIQFFSGGWILSQSSFFPIYLEENLALAAFAISVMVAVGQVAGMLTALLGGGFTDAWGSKRVLLLGLAGAVVATLLFQSPWVGAVALLWFLAGASNSLLTLGGSSYMTRAADPRRLGVLAALYALSGTLGGALGSPAAGRLLDTRGYSVYGLAGSAMLFATLLFTAFLLPGQSVEGAEHRQVHAIRGMVEISRKPVMRTLAGLRFLPTIYYGMSLVLIPLMINHIAGNKTTVAAYTTASLICASLAQLLTGRAADRFGHRWPTLIGFGALMVAALGLAAFSQQLWGIFVFGILGAAAAWSLAALMFVLVADGLPRAEHGRAFGLLHATWSIAMVCGSVLGGALTRVTTGLPFLVAALLLIPAILLTLSLFAQLTEPQSAEMITN